MKGLSITKILGSIALIAFTGTIAASATGAFFSDTETSSGNTFTAGSIDLKIDNTSYVTNNAGVLVASPANSWTLNDLTNQLFFSFADVKPGDVGEDTISVHPGSNDAYACMALDLSAKPDNGINGPEAAAGDVTDGPQAGELQNYLNFTFWKDDGDNVYEQGETIIPSLTGSASTIFNGAWATIADSASGPAIPGNGTAHIAKAWCFGTMTPTPFAQDGLTTSGPLVRGTGFTCSGAGNQNDAQTDGLVINVSFQAVQARNNGQFLCSSLPPFVGTGAHTVNVGPNDLETTLANAPTSKKWYFYDDTADVLNNTLGTFVAGPASPFFGTGSAFVNPLAGANSRTVLANSQFGGTSLAAITEWKFGEYTPSGAWSATEAPFMRFNVDFSGSASYQGSLVYVPSVNGAVTQNSWQQWDLISGGTAKWSYSGAFWPAGVSTVANTVPGTTARTLSSIIADYPAIRMHPGFPFVGVRVGEPGPVGLNANIDYFKINVGTGATTYDFNN